MTCPTSGPVPLTRLKTPAGAPAASMISANRMPLIGAISLGFRTTVQPAASAGRDLADDLVERPVPRRDQRGDADRLLDDQARSAQTAEFVALERLDGRFEMHPARPDLRFAGEGKRRAHFAARRPAQAPRRGSCRFREPGGAARAVPRA